MIRILTGSEMKKDFFSGGFFLDSAGKGGGRGQERDARGGTFKQRKTTFDSNLGGLGGKGKKAMIACPRDLNLECLDMIGKNKMRLESSIQLHQKSKTMKSHCCLAAGAYGSKTLSSYLKYQLDARFSSKEMAKYGDFAQMGVETVGKDEKPAGSP